MTLIFSYLNNFPDKQLINFYPKLKEKTSFHINYNKDNLF